MVSYVDMDTLIRIIADGLVVAVFLLAMYGFVCKIPRTKWLYWAPRIAVVGVCTYMAAKVAAYFYQPETLRPFEKLGVDPGAAYLNNPGFPSDHALFAMFLVCAVWVSTRSKWLTFTMLAMTLLMCVGRVLALVHTPVDVIGGLLIACCCATLYRLLVRNVVKYPPRARKEKKHVP